MPADVEPVHYFKGRIAFEEGRYDEAVHASCRRPAVATSPAATLRLAKDTRAITQDHVAPRASTSSSSRPRARTSCSRPTRSTRWRSSARRWRRTWATRRPGRCASRWWRTRASCRKVSTLTRDADSHHRHHRHLQVQQADGDQPQGAWCTATTGSTRWRTSTCTWSSRRRASNTVPIWMHEGLAKYLESRWRGAAGGAMTPSTLALLGTRVRHEHAGALREDAPVDGAAAHRRGRGHRLRRGLLRHRRCSTRSTAPDALERAARRDGPRRVRQAGGRGGDAPEAGPTSRRRGSRTSRSSRSPRS